MNEFDEATSSRHVEDLLVAYIEGRLSTAEQEVVKAHLHRCSKCSHELAELRNVMFALGENKRVFCPSPSELYEAAQGGLEPGDLLADHLRECPACRTEFGSYRDSTSKETISPALWSLVRQQLPTGNSAEHNSIWGKLRETVPMWLRSPAMSAVAVGAAILLLVVFYPREIPDTMVCLSSVTWNKVPRPKSGQQTTKELTAFVIVQKHFAEPLSQKEIDSIYEALEPGIEWVEHYRFVSPSAVKAVIKEWSGTTQDRVEALKALQSDLNVHNAVLITIVQLVDGIEVNTRFIDLAQGSTIRSRFEEVVDRQQLASRIREGVALLMAPSE